MMVSPALPISLCLLASYSHASDAASLLAFHPAAFTSQYARAITIRSRPSTSTYLQTSPTSLPFYTANTRSAAYNNLQYQHARARQPSKLHGKKDKYGIEKKSQQEILFELESKLDYEGRISSKVTSSSSSEEEDDEEYKNDDDDDDVDEGVVATATAGTGNPHRCGLITILGEPNMGKSTLLNALLSDDLAIATSRPQTTRHAILGVMTTDHTQLCLTDTPGIIGSPSYRLQEGMMDTVRGAVNSADAFLVVTDVYSGVEKTNDENDDEVDSDEEDLVEQLSEAEEFMGIGQEMLNKLIKYQLPVIICVNKVDLAAEKDNDGKSNVYTNTPTQAIQTIHKWRSVLPDSFAIIPTCAANGPDDPGVVALRTILLANDDATGGMDVGDAIRGLGRPVPGMFADNKPFVTQEDAQSILPIGPPLYHPDFFTDRTDRFCASELIRETLFESLGKELPYCCEVRVEMFDESQRYFDEEDDDDNDDGPVDDAAGKRKKRKSIIRIGATVLVERDTQKGIVVGKGGQMIKDVGTAARKKLQEFFGVKIFLEIRVKVDKNWRNNAEALKKYGYTQ